MTNEPSCHSNPRRKTCAPRSQNFWSICQSGKVERWKSKTKMFSCKAERCLSWMQCRQTRMQDSKKWKTVAHKNASFFLTNVSLVCNACRLYFSSAREEQSEKLSTFLGHKLTPSTINTWNMRPHTLPPRDKVWPHKLKPTLEKIGYISPWKMYLNYNLSLRSAKHISSKRIYLPKCKKCVSPHSWTK